MQPSEKGNENPSPRTACGAELALCYCDEADVIGSALDSAYDQEQGMTINQSVKDRMLSYFQAHCDADGLVSFTNRDLGRAIHCSIGNFPRLLDQLVAENKIEIKTDHSGSTLRLLEAGRPNRLIVDLNQRLDTLSAEGQLTQRQRAILRKYLP